MASGNIVQFGDWISNGWNLFKSQWQTWTLMGVLFFGPILLMIALFVVIVIVAADSIRHESTAIIYILMATLVMFLFIIVYASYIIGGLFKTAFKQYDGETITSGDIWSGGNYTLRILGANILIMFFTLIGAILCYFPAFIVQGWLFFTIPLIVRKNLGVLEALKQSYEIAKQDWFMFTLFAFVVGLISQLGLYACYIGIVFTLPLLYTITVVAYIACFEPDKQRYVTEQPAMGSRACKVCGKRIPGNANFCDNCGAGQN